MLAHVYIFIVNNGSKLTYRRISTYIIWQMIPESLTARMLNLVVLDVHSNQLKSLPNSIGCLSKLKVLNVSGNLIESLPRTIENCRFVVSWCSSALRNILYAYSSKFFFFPILLLVYSLSHHCGLALVIWSIYDNNSSINLRMYGFLQLS